MDILFITFTFYIALGALWACVMYAALHSKMLYDACRKHPDTQRAILKARDAVDKNFGTFVLKVTLMWPELLARFCKPR